MPWWRFWRPDTEDEQQAAAQAEALVEQRKQAVEALSNGDIPAIAKERILKHSGRNDKFFTSDLSVNEFLLMKESGVEVISQVMGTCYYNVGFFAAIGVGRYTGEMTKLTEAQSHSRLLAMQRMQQEAKLLGASGVVGVRLQVKRPDVGNRHTEFTAFGTAVKIAGYPAGAEPFISNLSGQEFWKLHTAGYRPVGVVMGCCSYYVYTDYQTRRQQTGFFFTAPNQEIVNYTQSFYNARELSMWRLDCELKELSAEGAIGVDVDFDIEEIEYEQSNQKQIDLLLHFTALGTAIEKSEAVPARAPLMYIDLSKGKNSGALVALEEYTPTDNEES
jgi:uncharacterized protein YbjQ (UPF0145 family)